MKKDAPIKDPRSSTMEVESMTALELLAKIRNATGEFAMSICEQSSWSDEDIDELGKCSRILVSIARLEMTPTDGLDKTKSAADATDEELERAQ